MIPFSAIVRELPATIPFVGPEAIERRIGRPFELRVGANESAFGVSPSAARRNARRDRAPLLVWRPEGHDLRAALAEHHGVEPGEVCLGAGIDELLGFVVRMLSEPGTPVVTSAGAYRRSTTTSRASVRVSSRCPTATTTRTRTRSRRPSASAARPLLYLANPDNPMGTWHDAARVRAFIEALPEDVVLALDEAYIEFAPAGVDWPMAPDDPRVLRLRTFSKAHGMAGARIGYCVGHRDPRDRARQDPEPLRSEPDRAGRALASLRDPEFVAGVIAEVAAGRDEYARLAGSLGLVPLRSATNFVAIDVGGGRPGSRPPPRARGAPGLRAHAGGRAPRPLHPGYRRNRARACRVRGGPSRGPRRRRRRPPLSGSFLG